MNLQIFLTLFYPIFITSIAVGPVFITLANLSITYGLRHGLFAVIGVIFGNILYMILGALTARQIINEVPKTVMLFISFFATLFLIYVAYGFWKKDVSKMSTKEIQKQNFGTIIKMFCITLSSPVVIAGYSITFLTFADKVRVSFVSALLGGVCGATIAYTMIAVFFGLLGKKILALGPKKYKVILSTLNKIAAVLLFAFASVIVVNFVREIVGMVV